MQLFVFIRTKLWVDVKGNDAPDKYKEPGDATLAFSFLSIPVWVRATHDVTALIQVVPRSS